MNKTVTINIAGLFFHIDEDAYTKLSNYLEAIKNSLNTEGKEEIINDIESRIAEIFSAEINPTGGVVNITNVDDVIKIMGQPEDYRLDDETEDANSNQENKQEYKSKRSKKLFRDGDNRIIGGVLSGLGNYFNIDSIWIRIIFIILIFPLGVSAIIYPILWIIIPKAKTTADFLEMKGEPVNISNIEKAVKQNIDYLGNNIRNIDTKRIREAGSTIGDVLKKIIGVSFITIGILGIMGSFIFYFALNTSVSKRSFSGIPVNQIVELGYPAWSPILAVSLMAFIPMLILFLVGLKLTYKNIKYIGLVSILLGFIFAFAVIFFAAVMIEVKNNDIYLNKLLRDSNKTTVVKKSLDHITNDTLNIDLIRDPRFYGINDTLSSQNSFEETRDIEIEIEQSSNQTAFFEIKTDKKYSKSVRLSLGNNNENSIISDESNMLNYYSNTNNNTIELADAIISKKNNSDHILNSVEIKLYLPQNKKVRINSNNKNYFNYNHDIKDGINYYILNGENLECISCN